MKFQIRKMTLDDLAQVIAIDRASFSLPWPERSFRFEITDNPASRCWVVEMDGHITGTLVLWLILDEAHIATIAIHPDYRRQGIGQALLLHALKSAVEEGATSSFLEVRESNLVAQAMYQKYGFVATGRRMHYYKDNEEDAILMTASLTKLKSLTR
jgi:[ribosomal protein S18]-alanine N-acetyltransferase